MKVIHFYLTRSNLPADAITTIIETIWAIDRLNDVANLSYHRINTTCVSLLNFDLLDEGFDIHLHSDAKHSIRLVPHMGKKQGYTGGKDIRKEHNLLRVLLAGTFNDDLFDKV